MRISLSIFIISLLFNGCTILNTPKDTSNLTTKFSFLSKRLSSNICPKIKNNSTLYVTDFVNESNLQNISQLGFLLSNELKVNILKNNCTNKVSIKNLQLSKSLQIGKQGTRILTRNLKNLKTKNLKDDRQILVGTYMITKKQLILFLKLINLKDGNTIATSSIATIMTDEIKELDGINTNTDPIIYKPFHL